MLPFRAVFLRPGWASGRRERENETRQAVKRRCCRGIMFTWSLVTPFRFFLCLSFFLCVCTGSSRACRGDQEHQEGEKKVTLPLTFSSLLLGTFFVVNSRNSFLFVVGCSRSHSRFLYTIYIFGDPRSGSISFGDRSEEKRKGNVLPFSSAGGGCPVRFSVGLLFRFVGV